MNERTQEELRIAFALQKEANKKAINEKKEIPKHGLKNTAEIRVNDFAKDGILFLNCTNYNVYLIYAYYIAHDEIRCSSPLDFTEKDALSLFNYYIDKLHQYLLAEYYHNEKIDEKEREKIEEIFKFNKNICTGLNIYNWNEQQATLASNYWVIEEKILKNKDSDKYCEELIEHFTLEFFENTQELL